MVQKKLENFGAAYNQYNTDTLVNYYKLNSALDFFYQVAVKNIDLKELKEFHLLGDRLEPPKPARVIEPKIDSASVHSAQRKDAELIIFGESSDRIVYTL